MFTFCYPLPDWLRDHQLGGRTILPAVESMRLAAAAYAVIRPTIQPNLVLRARFLRLVEIADQERELNFFVEVREEEGRELLSLSRRVTQKGITRRLSWAELELAEEEKTAFLVATPQLPRASPPKRPDAVEIQLPSAQVYAELVPFGPALQSLSGNLWVNGLEAGGEVCAPVFNCEHGSIGANVHDLCNWLGSPFPLDGAMHVACVHGQRLVSFVPFPVAMRRRRIHKATQPGQCYQVRVCLRRQETDELEYDLWLLQGGELYEEVQGLLMRDVSGGRLRPPAWLQGLGSLA
ncbi:MAG: hypothetical protein GX087_03445 [Desulfobulbaceae bacterium]|nr:hypothetical protein [Desulfobulbaceae bacterium]